uniref:Transport and golgi organization 6 homolog (Drosophila) n=1 Tax=Takifugu rubripes TaxID=31033 RepID=H2RPL6_TAKRU
MTALILSAINILTKPLDDAQCSPEEAVSAALQANTSSLLEQLEEDRALGEVRRLREAARAQALWFSSPTGDVAWDFVQECLMLLLTLARHLSAELERFQQSSASEPAEPPAAEAPPPLSPDVLSVTQQKALSSALQFVVSLGLCPYLAPGVGLPLAHRSAFGAKVQKLCSRTVQEPRRRLFTTTTVLLKVAALPSLAAVVFMQHLNDLMAALCQLGYQTECVKGSDAEKLSAEECQACREALKGLLRNIYQPIVIQQLLLLQNGPKKGSAGSLAEPGSSPGWLRRLCGQLLSERLMQPRGVHAVVTAILGQGETLDWRKCEAVARILVTCPQQSASADSYYRTVCPQILDLLHFRDKLVARPYHGVAVRTVHVMAEERPGVAQQLLLLPLLTPLHRCIPAPREPGSQEAVEEWELSRCIDGVHKICLLGDGQPASLLKALQEVLPIIFTLFCFTKQNVSHLRTSCQEILLWFLGHAHPGEALLVLQQLSGLQGPRGQAAASLHFSPGSEGGARLYEDEEDVLYEKLSAEQWRLECLMHLLAELQDSDLPGAFFLHLLQELTTWASSEEEGSDEEELAVGSMTLQAGEDGPRTEGRGGRLALLQVLAGMVECLHHTVLLRKRTQVVDFLATLFQRACVGLDQASNPGLVNLVDRETLSLGMGLLASLLSEQLTADDYLPMLKLLPVLEKLSQVHSVAAVQELAFSLRSVIATRGAFQPEDLRQHSRRFRSTGKQRTPAQVDHSRMPPQCSASNRFPPPSTQKIPSASSGGAAGEALKNAECSSRPTDPPQTHFRGFSDVLLEALDPDVPTRAAALRELTQMVQHKRPEALQAQEEILNLFLKNVEHEDSFIYLSAIQGLAVLADLHPEPILKRLLQDFQRGSSSPAADHGRSLEIRLKMGEVLMRASSALGDLTPHLGYPLVGVFLQGTKDPDQSIRASSLANLGALCRGLDYSLGPLAAELSSCLTALIKTEREAEVRRAAVHVITQLLRGLCDRTTQVLSEVLLDLYRALRWVVGSDPDDVAVLHAQLALEELDTIMRRFIFPEQKLQKKIVVLP